MEITSDFEAKQCKLYQHLEVGLLLFIATGSLQMWGLAHGHHGEASGKRQELDISNLAL